MKKWSYVTAMMLAVSTGCVFTGCINNDEPYGIEQIRVATANLLEAKKAGAAADAAAAQLREETAKIQAETERIKQEIAKIQAEAAAEASKLQAEAAAAKDKAEAARIQAEADAIIALAKARAAEIQADADYRSAEATELANRAAQALEEAKYWFEKAKADNAAAANDALYQALEAAFNNYLVKIGQLNHANELLIQAQNAYNNAMFDLEWKDGEWVSERYNQEKVLEDNVKYAQNQIDQINADIQKYEDAIAELEGKQPAELKALLEKYNAEAEANEEALAEAQVEKEALYLDNKDLYDSRVALDKEIQAEKEKPVAIAPYTYEPTEELKVLGLTESNTIVGEGESFNLTPEGEDKYNEVLAKYEWQKYQLEKYLLDANDVEWTKARVAEMERELKVANTTYEADKAAWELAKKVYNKGGVADATVLPLATELQAAIDAFAASKTSIDAAIANVKDTENAYNDAVAAREAEEEKYGTETNAQVVFDAAKKAYDDAVEAAQKAYDEAEAAAAAPVNAIYEEYNAATQKLWIDYQNAEKDVNHAKEQLAMKPTDKNLQKAVEDAEAAAEKIAKDMEGLWGKYEEKISKADEAYLAAVLKANDEKYAAEKAARLELQKAQATYNANLANDPAYAPVKAALDAESAAFEAYNVALEAREEARAASWDLWSEVGTVIQNQINEIDYYWANMFDCYLFAENALNQYTSGVYGAEWPVLTVPALYMDEEQVYINAKNYLIEKSGVAYGLLGVEYDGNDPFDVDMAFLIDKVTKETVDEYLKAAGQDEMDYPYCYRSFIGSFGEVLYLENRIAVANACLSNSDLSNQAIEAMNANLETLAADKKTAEEAVEALEDKKEAVNDQIADLEQAINDKIADLGHVKSVLANIIRTLNGALANLDMDGAIEDFQAQIDELKGDLEDAQEKLALAQYQLDEYNNGYYNVWKQALELRIQMEEALVENLQKDVEFAKARVDELQAKYDAANKQ